MKWNLLPFWMRKSEDEYITAMRRHVALWDRMRYVMILFCISLLVAGTIIVPRAIDQLLEMVEPECVPEVKPWVTTGMTLGFFTGFMFYNAFFSLTLGLNGYRSERLLLKYYDAKDSEQPENAESDEQNC